MKELWITFLLTLFPVIASSQPGTWTPYQNIQTIIIENGIALLIMQGGVSSSFIPAECNKQYNQADLSTEHGRAIYSMALAAKLAEKPVSLALDCLGSRPHIKLIRM